MDEYRLHTLDLIVIALFFTGMLVIGFYCTRRNKSSDGYFLAGRKMPGWVVGFSLMATLISSMTFLAAPGFAFKHNWRYIPANITFVLAAFFAITIFMPIFRRAGLSSSYEYLEKRFGSWVRFYAALGYALAQAARLGLVMYTVSLPIQVMTGWPLPLIIIGFGIIVAAYTIAGGLEAVIWTDLIQGMSLIIGGFICLPLIIFKLPGGFEELISVAWQDGKMSLGDMSFTLKEKTMWVMILPAFFHQIWCTEQTTIQRYIAPKSEKSAKNAIYTGVFTCIPIWMYFTFIGTAIYVYYKAFPNPSVNEMVPEQVFPFFILTVVPAGLSGFVIAGLLAAAMSSLDSSINAAAATVTYDFYKRLFVKNRDEVHYLKAGRWISVFFGVVMIGLALLIHFMRNQTIQDLNTLLVGIFGAGLFAMYMTGMLTLRVGNFALFISLVVTLAGVIAWLFFGSALGEEMFPSIAVQVPDKFWIPILSNILLFTLAYLLSFIYRKDDSKNIKNLSLQTLQKETAEQLQSDKGPDEN